MEGESCGLDAATGVAGEGDEERDEDRDEAVAEHGEGEREVEGEVEGEGEGEGEVKGGCCSAGEVEDCLGRLRGDEEEPRRGNLRFLNAVKK